MKFKFLSKNGYRDLVRNLRKILISKLSDDEKASLIKDLFQSLSKKLDENDKLILNQTAFSSKCQHWNFVYKPKPSAVTNLKNPWLRLKREVEESFSLDSTELVVSVSKSLAWFYRNSYRDAWIVD